MTTTKRIDLAIDALIQDNSAEALGHLMLYKMEQIEEVKTVTTTEFQKAVANGEYTTDLPPITPIKDKELKPIDFKCPTCGAKPGKPCVKVSTRGKEAKGGPKSLGEPLEASKRHSARRLLWNQSRGLA